MEYIGDKGIVMYLAQCYSLVPNLRSGKLSPKDLHGMPFALA